MRGRSSHSADSPFRLCHLGKYATPTKANRVDDNLQAHGVHVQRVGLPSEIGVHLSSYMVTVSYGLPGIIKVFIVQCPASCKIIIVNPLLRMRSRHPEFCKSEELSRRKAKCGIKSAK